MIVQMAKVLLMGLAFIYLVMVAQFQSLLSPFIVLFTVPLAFTGGLIGLLIMGEPLSVMGMMGFVVLLGTVVNNGIVFVDYALTTISISTPSTVTVAAVADSVRLPLISAKICAAVRPCFIAASRFRIKWIT